MFSIKWKQKYKLDDVEMSLLKTQLRLKRYPGRQTVFFVGKNYCFGANGSRAYPRLNTDNIIVIKNSFIIIHCLYYIYSISFK